ncbi:hypothetical protein DOTSEDRAFT_112696, partial [Dothistroma septosporum NZE10]
DLEKELSCSICTDILYQPLTLLDCLHTFCGCCMQEWFTWQRAAAVSSRRSNHPYTCPSCRETVRATKADWRLSTLLEGYLRANPDRAKSEEEKEEMRKHYKPGDDVLPAVHAAREEEDSEDERLIAEVRELSMASVDPSAARHRTDRATRDRQRQGQERRASSETRHTAEELRRQQQSSRWVAMQATRQGSVEDRQIEHQPSLRSLLSGSDISSEDVQEVILQSIYAEGLLNGIDIDNLTPAQEEELTERIAEAYRRRQRYRERSRNRARVEQEDRHSQSQSHRMDNPARGQRRAETSQSQQQQAREPRARPPISRPHLFEQTGTGADHGQRRSASSTSRHRVPAVATDSGPDTSQAARSVTDLSQEQRTEGMERSRPRASSSNARGTTDPSGLRSDVQRVRGASALRSDVVDGSARPISRDSQAQQLRRQTDPPTISINQSPAPRTQILGAVQDSAQLHAVRPAISKSAFAPEAVQVEPMPSYPPSVSCSLCSKPHIETKLHYNCSKCDGGDLNLCLQCYRGSQGCHHWFGFGFAALSKYNREAPPEGYPRRYDYPHILTPRRFKSQSSPTSIGLATTSDPEEGAFCEFCFSNANRNYWYCAQCLDGAWGFCNTCLLRGNHCTHPLLPLAHISTLPPDSSRDPSRLQFVPLPNLKQHSYVHVPAITACDICTLDIPSTETRYHCQHCNAGDYDICNTCYANLVSTGKISHPNGPNGWRRCLQGHCMSIIGFSSTAHGQVRSTIWDPVGGFRLREDPGSIAAPPPPDHSSSGTGTRRTAGWSWFPAEESLDELPFPRNAEVRECEDLNADWAVGVYAGRVGVFP